MDIIDELLQVIYEESGYPSDFCISSSNERLLGLISKIGGGERIKELETHLSRMTNFYGIELREHGIDATTDKCYMESMKVLEKGK